MSGKIALFSFILSFQLASSGAEDLSRYPLCIKTYPVDAEKRLQCVAGDLESLEDPNIETAPTRKTKSQPALESDNPDKDHMEKRIAICAAKETDAVRLICYDNLAQSLGVDKPKISTRTGRGRWKVQTEISPIDDSTNVYVWLESNEPVKSGYKTARPTLFVRCKENRTQVFVNWDINLGMDKTRVITRFDNLKAYTGHWDISTDHNATFSGGGDIPFARRMMNHEKLLLEITPYSESPVMAIFDISGLSEAIKPLRKACHW